MADPTILPFLMFQGEGNAALAFYQSVFPEARIDEMERYCAGDSGPEGTIKKARFTIGGQSVLCTDSPIKHGFAFTPSFSFWVECGSEEDVRHYAGMLRDGGGELMLPADYGFSRFFTWVSDRFGVSWQLNWS